jgi:hypothetical protein
LLLEPAARSTAVDVGRECCRDGVTGSAAPTPAARALLDYFRCSSAVAAIESGDADSAEGYFTFHGNVCYGRRRGGPTRASADVTLPDVSDLIEISAGRVRLPFDLAEVAANLREERYARPADAAGSRLSERAAVRSLYYLLRPLLPVGVRKHLQRIRLNGWRDIAFPRWPVDTSVDSLMRHVLEAVVRSGAAERVPFVWFWPDAAPTCIVMTHDVEGAEGHRFCAELMDIDESFGIRSAFQVVPELRGTAWRGLADRIRSRGFEVNVHDLNHDGYLFHNYPQFLRRARQINRYVREYGARGFRAGAMYRDQRWYDAFEFSYDMSVPNAAHLEPQRGGCCTVMPYFVGRILELPLTTTQDYSLFHILGDYSTALWQQEIDEIGRHNGLVTLLTHPDYLVERKARAVYVELLKHLRRIGEERKAWMALPADVDEWWRNRSAMTLVPQGSTWRVEGKGSERARVAYASLRDGRLVYEVD